MKPSEYRKFDGLGLAELIRTKDVSPQEVMQAANEIIEDENKRVNAVVDRFDEGISVADAQFSGVPFLIKDLGMHIKNRRMQSGSRLFQNYVSDHDSTLVKRYRAAGLRLMGKTNTPEFGLATTTEPVLNGPTRNPASIEHSAGGSSGGAAAAVASGMVPMAHASDGGGSIRIPASCCGLVGLKPTRGRVPLGPSAVEGWGGLSTTHAITRTVRDSAALLDVSKGDELGAPYSAPEESRSYLVASSRDPSTLKIGLCSASFAGEEVDSEVLEALNEFATKLEKLGHTVVLRAPQIDTVLLKDSHGILAISHVAAMIEERLAVLGREIRADDVEKVTFRNYQSGHSLTGAQYAWAQNQARKHGITLARYFDEGIDLMLTPTMAILTPKLGALDMMSDDEARYLAILYGMIGFTALFNDTGLPAISLPVAVAKSGLPIGMQFVAPMGGESLLLSMAGQVEREGWFHSSTHV